MSLEAIEGKLQDTSICPSQGVIIETLVLSQNTFPYLQITRISEGKEGEKEIKNVFEEIVSENFPSLQKETDIQVQEAKRVPFKMKSNRPTPRHIIIEMVKVKIKKWLQRQQEKNKELITKEPPQGYELISIEMLQARCEWQDMFKVPKGKKSAT